MTTIRDFSAPDGPDTMQNQQHIVFDEPARTVTMPNGYITQSRSRDRRDSVASGSSAQTNNTARRRARERSNTVRTYHEPEHPNWEPGAEPGIDTAVGDERLPPLLSSLKAKCDIKIIDYSPTGYRERLANNKTLPELLAEPRPNDLRCRWISVNGRSWDVIKCLGNKFRLHRLAIEDLIHTHTRTKVDWYADHAFVVLTLQKLVRLHRHPGRDETCDCMDGPESDTESVLSDIEADEKVAEEICSPAAEVHDHHKTRRRSKLWKTASKLLKKNESIVLPRYVEHDADSKMDEFIRAHSNVSEKSPIRQVRTLHRYESAQIPSHTAFMEKHSALAAENLAVSVEQVCVFLMADNTILSFFEQSADDIETPILARLQSEETMLRRSADASLMLQAIIDAIVDLAVPVRYAYNKSRKELQIDAMTSPDIKTSRALHIFGEEVDMLQNLVKPIVHLVNALRDHNSGHLSTSVHQLMRPMDDYYDEEQISSSNMPGDAITRERDSVLKPQFARASSEYRRNARRRTELTSSVTITPLAYTYFGDVLDHCITIIQALEQMDASATNISTLIFNTVGAKTNNFMMILAAVTVFFAPLTFISGYFGMNFSSGHGLDHPFAFFWTIALPVLALFMFGLFGYMLRDKVEDFFTRRELHKHRKRRSRR